MQPTSIPSMGFMGHNVSQCNRKRKCSVHPPKAGLPAVAIRP